MKALKIIVSLAVAFMMLAVPFSISDSSDAEDPVMEKGLYFKTDSTLTMTADMKKIFTEDNLLDSIVNIVETLDFVPISDDPDPSLLTELSLEAGMSGKVDGDTIKENSMYTYSGKIAGSYTYTLKGAGSANLYGEDALEVYKYLGDHDMLTNVTVTLDLRFTEDVYRDAVFKFIKIKNDKYTLSSSEGSIYYRTKIAGTVTLDPIADGEPTKVLTVDYDLAEKISGKMWYDFDEPDTSKIDIGSECWIVLDIEPESSAKYKISFDGRTYDLDLVEVLSKITSEFPGEGVLNKLDLNMFDIEDAVTMDVSLGDGNDYDLPSLLTSDVDEKDLAVACEEVGTVLDTYSDVKPKVKDTPEISDDDRDDDDNDAKIPLIIGGVVLIALVAGGIAIFVMKRKG